MTTPLPKALRLADVCDTLTKLMLVVPGLDTVEAAAELRRLHQHELALQDWLDKTDWVQESAQGHELGMHRADVLRKRIEKLKAVNQELLEALQNLENDDSSIPPHAWAIVQAAIAKAEGEKT